MEVEDLVGAKIISIEKSLVFGAEIQDITVEKDNKHIKIIGTEEYPWISWYIDAYFCPTCDPNCETVMTHGINKEKR